MRGRPWVHWLALGVWMAVIYRASATPNLQSVPLAQRYGLLPGSLSGSMVHALELIIRKGAHLFAFGLLAILWLRALSGTIARGAALRILTALGLTAAYALTDEWHQTFIPGREGRLLDVLIDTVGGVAGLGLAITYATLAGRRRST